MSILDIIILLLLTAGMVRGFFKGFVIEFFSLLALITGIIVCLKLNPLLLDMLAKHSVDHWVITYSSYLALFLLIFGVVFYMGVLLERLLKLTRLNYFNRLAGSLFALVKVIFMISLLLWISESFEIIPNYIVEKSFGYTHLSGFAPYVMEQAGNLWPFLEGLVEQTEEYLEQILHEF